MAVSMARRVRQAVRSWRRTDFTQVSADPADVESVTIRYLMYVLLSAWFPPGVADGVLATVASLIAAPLWRCARTRNL
jgi:hypothetical protein